MRYGEHAVALTDARCEPRPHRQLLVGELPRALIASHEAIPIREGAHLAEELCGLTAEVGEQSGLDRIEAPGDALRRFFRAR